MESNWCFPNKRKTLNEEQKIDNDNKVKEKILREKEISSRLNEEQKDDGKNNVESNWFFPIKRKTLINEQEKIDKNNKAKEKRLREKGENLVLLHLSRQNETFFVTAERESEPSEPPIWNFLELLIYLLKNT